MTALAWSFWAGAAFQGAVFTVLVDDGPLTEAVALALISGLMLWHAIRSDRERRP